MSIKATFADRALIDNVWDSDLGFAQAKQELREDPSPAKIASTKEMGLALLNNVEPYKTKVGLLLLRLCIWCDVDFAHDYTKHIVLPFVRHTHPRIRQSALWNIRATVWQDRELIETVLPLLKTAVDDPEPAIRRMTLWILGDCAFLNRIYLSPVHNLVKTLLNRDTKESTYLFALEHYFRTNQIVDSSLIDDFAELIQKNSYGMIGLKQRCLKFSSSLTTITQDEFSYAKKNLEVSVADILDREFRPTDTNESTVDKLYSYFKQTSLFKNRMKVLWLLRRLLWHDAKIAPKVYELLEEHLLAEKDGDLCRTLSVVLGDAIRQSNGLLVNVGRQHAVDFFSSSDIDGSQIVIAKNLVTRKSGSLEDVESLKKDLARLNSAAANHSVSAAVGSTTFED
jgi:DNA-binding ferritin-like protein (Dps family)